MMTGGRGVHHEPVYEYNVGNYSPTNVVIARDAPSILHIFGGLHLTRGSRSYFRKESKSPSSKQPVGRCISNAALFAFRRKAVATLFFYCQCNTHAA
jgi:hypothetical protein